MRNQVGPSGPHAVITDLGPHSAPAERWHVWAREGGLSQSHASPGLSFFLGPDHTGLLVGVRLQGRKCFEENQSPSLDGGRRSWALECVHPWTNPGLYFKNKSLLSPVSLLVTHMLNSDVPTWLQVAERVRPPLFQLSQVWATWRGKECGPRLWPWTAVWPLWVLVPSYSRDVLILHGKF